MHLRTQDSQVVCVQGRMTSKASKGKQATKNIDSKRRMSRSLAKVFLVDIIRKRRSSGCRNMEGLHIPLTSSLEFNAIFG